MVGRGASAAARTVSFIASSPITRTPAAPAAMARRSCAGAWRAATGPAGRGALRVAVSSAMTAAAPNRSGRSAQLTKVVGARFAAVPPAAASLTKTAIFPRKTAGSSVTVVSFQRPAKTAAVPRTAARAA
jgi:hypothetical protein